MKLDCVLTACNNNNLYSDFIPLFVKSWKKLYNNIDVKIIFISNTIPSNLIDYSNNIILFNEIPNVSSAFISQYIRLLYPCILNYENGVLITDIDMIPMNNIYYTENIKNFDNNKFIYMRNILLDLHEFCICYNIATPATWKEIFNIHNINDIIINLTCRFNQINYDINKLNGWNTDQKDLYNFVVNWNNKTNNLIILNDNDTKFNRLDRSKIKYLKNSIKYNIKNNIYSDYHCLRPYNSFKHINDSVFNLL
jgi:hypothetical protein